MSSASFVMCSGPPLSSRPVFYRAALLRLLRQPIISRLRFLSAISSVVISDLIFYIPRLPNIIPFFRSHPPPRIVPLNSPSNLPALHFYPSTQTSTTKPAVLYVHGGAWGSGSASFFSPIAHSIRRLTDSPVVLLDYRIYPEGLMQQQVDDVRLAMTYLRYHYPQQRIVVVAHSSGAHITTCALLHAALEGEERLADGVVLSSGVYDLERHFLYEARRGVAELSPMMPACGGDEDLHGFHQWSPRRMAHQVIKNGGVRQESTTLESIGELEGELMGRAIDLPAVCRGGNILFPNVMIMCGSCDRTVPMYGSVGMAADFRTMGVDAKLCVYDLVDHVDFVLDWFGGRGVELSDVADIGEGEKERREGIRRMLGGTVAVDAERQSKKMGVASHVADVVRFIRSFQTQNSCTQEDGGYASWRDSSESELEVDE